MSSMAIVLKGLAVAVLLHAVSGGTPSLRDGDDGDLADANACDEGVAGCAPTNVFLLQERHVLLHEGAPRAKPRSESAAAAANASAVGDLTPDVAVPLRPAAEAAPKAPAPLQHTTLVAALVAAAAPAAAPAAAASSVRLSASMMVLCLFLVSFVVVCAFMLFDTPEPKETSAPNNRVSSLFTSRGLNMDLMQPNSSSLAQQPRVSGSASAALLPPSNPSLRSANLTPELRPSVSSPQLENRKKATDAETRSSRRQTFVNSLQHIPPAICPALVMPNTETRFLIPIEELKNYQGGELAIKGNSGRALLTATIAPTNSGGRALSISSVGCASDPRTTLIVEKPGVPHVLLGKDHESYGTLELGPPPPLKSILKRHDAVVMHLEMTNASNFSIIVYTTEGATLGTSGPKEAMWRMQVKPGVDAVLLATCMLAMVIFGNPEKL